MSMATFLFSGLVVVYFVWTLKFAIDFNKSDRYFQEKQRRLHNILIWIVPFIWIVVIQTMTKPTPGSHNFKKKQDEDSFYESGLGG